MIVDEYKVKHRMLVQGIDHITTLARLADLNPKTVAGVMGSGKWQAETVSKIATALRCSPLELITVEEDC